MNSIYDAKSEMAVQLKKFWETEEIFEAKPFSNEEYDYFQRTIRREKKGRSFISFKNSFKKLRNSKINAKKTLNPLTEFKRLFATSFPTSSVFSLNNLQAIGPSVQRDRIDILSNFRIFQVLLETDKRCLQRMLWRKNPSERLKLYQLNRLTVWLLDQISSDI